MSLQTYHLYEFGPYRLNPSECLLTEGGRNVPLTPKAFQTLLVLVENQGRLVEKEELLQKVWPDTFVEEATLAQNVFTLRKQLRDDRAEAVYIETVPKRGYRFAAPVRLLHSPPSVASGAVRHTSAVEPAPATRRSARFRWTAISTLVLITAGGLLVWRQSRAPVVSHHPMIAVLPVENLTGDPQRQYVADGLTEELIAQLGSLNPDQMGVIARTSSMAYKNSSKTASEIGRELGVDYALESSLRESSDEIRFTAQLIRTSDQTHLWAHSYERPPSDVLQLQGELARTVADEIRIGITPQQKSRLSATRQINPEAYDAFVQGRFHWNERSPKELRLAISYFQQAIAKDPDFAPAYAGLADSYALLATMKAQRPGEVMPKAKDALLKALAIDDSLAEAHTSLAWIMEVFDWDWSGSDKEFRKAMALNPNDATVHHRYAIHLAAMGNLPQALFEMRVARRLDPLSPVIMTSTGWVLLRARLPDQAAVECRKALDLDPKFVRGHLCLGEAYEQKHDLNQAAAEFLQGKILGGSDTPEKIGALKDATAKLGYSGYFREILLELSDKSKSSYVSPYDMADIYVRLGDQKEALKWLNAAFEERSPYLVNLQIEPRMDALRSQPEFQALVEHVGLAGVVVSRITEFSPAPQTR